MALIKIKPTSPGLRAVVRNKNNQLHDGDPYHPLTEKNFVRLAEIIPEE